MVAEANKKPKPAAAKLAVEKWAKAMSQIDPEKPASFAAATAMTSVAFRAVMMDEEHMACDVTVTERDQLASTLACVRGAPYHNTKPYSPKILKELWMAMRDHKGEIEKLARTHLLFQHNESGADVHELVIIAVTQDDDGVARVAAIFAQRITT
jgi:hypothetical protein